PGTGTVMQELRLQPGLVRDAIIDYLRNRTVSATVSEICSGVCSALQRRVPDSSVRSYLNLNTPGTFHRAGHGRYELSGALAFLPPSSPAGNGTNGAGPVGREPPASGQSSPEP